MSIEADERISGIGFLISWEDGGCVLHARGAVDDEGEGLLSEAVKAILDTECQVVVDLRGVRFTGGSGVDALRELSASVRARGQSIRLRLGEVRVPAGSG